MRHLAQQSYFDNFTIELSAWAKDGEMGDDDMAAAAPPPPPADPAPADDYVADAPPDTTVVSSDGTDDGDVDDLLDY